MKKQIDELHIGRIGEHLVMADLLLKGHECFLSAQGMPYDVMADVGGRLVKIQVKTTATLKSIKCIRTKNPVFMFWIKRCGRNGKSEHTENNVDVFALVSLSEKSIGYISSKNMPRTFFVRQEKLRGKHHNEVLCDRNNEIKRRLNNGESISSISNETGIDWSYIKRTKDGKTKLKPDGVYMVDLSFEKALI